MTDEFDDERIDKDDERGDESDKAEQKDESDGFDRKGSDAVEGEVDHFFEWVFGFASESFGAFVCDGIGFETDERDDTAQK